MDKSETSSKPGTPWWSCLWICLVVTALALGVAALWMPLERHLRIENRLEEIKMKHRKMDQMLDILRNKSEIIQEGLDVNKEDLSLRRQEIGKLNKKHKEELEDLNSFLKYSQMNQSRVLDSLWAKVVEMEEDLGANGQKMIIGKKNGYETILDKLEDKVGKLEIKLEVNSKEDNRNGGDTQVVLRNIQNIVSRMSDLESLSRSMEQDIISYKTMFEKNNYIMANMSENVEDQIFALNERLDELDVRGKNQNSMENQQKMMKQLMDEMRRIENDFSLKFENDLFDVHSNYTKDHMEIVNTVSEHIQECNEALENENFSKENVTNIMNTLDTRIKQIEQDNEELNLIVSNFGKNIQEDIQFKLNTLSDKDKVNVVKIDNFESRIDTLTKKVNHFVQNVMVVRSLPQKVMIMQKKLAEIEEKINSKKL